MEEFTNSTVSFDSLPKFESVPFHPLNKAYLNVVYISNAIFSVVLAIALTLLLIFNEVIRENSMVFIVVLLVIIFFLFWISTIGFKKKGYALREKDILYRRGILSTTTTIIPFNRIQHVALYEGFFSRMYQLSELQVFTAGGSSSDLHIVGLPKEEAESIKSFLLSKINNPTEEMISMSPEIETPQEPEEESRDHEETETQN